MIESGAVFQIPPRLARPPQEAHRFNPAQRDSRWVVIISTPEQCLKPEHETVLGVLLSAQVEYAAEHDVLIYAGECVVEDSIAQADLLFTLSKIDLDKSRYRGTVQADTLKKVRATVARFLGFV